MNSISNIEYSAENEKLFFPAGKIQNSLLSIVNEELQEYLKLCKNLGAIERHKPHLLIPSVYELSESKDILSSVEKFLDDNVLLWYSVLFVKPKTSEGYIPWHYDDYFWSINGTNGCTVWIALNDIDKSMGPMEFTLDDTKNSKHFVENNPNNILSRGNASNYSPSLSTKKYIATLNKGEFSIHSNDIWHRSGPNLSSKDRLAIALRYITRDAKPNSFKLLKRGVVSKELNTKYFFTEQKPKRVLSPLKCNQHIYSVLFSVLISLFGDDKRKLRTQIYDCLKVVFSRKGLECCLSLFNFFKRKKSLSNLTSKINNG